jgi:spore germination protein YaaH
MSWTRRRWRSLLLLLGITVVAAIIGPFPDRAPQTVRAATLLRWGYYVTYDSGSLVSLQTNIGQLDIVSPYFYHVTSAGTIKDFDEPETTAFLKEQGVLVLPIIQNEARWDDFRMMVETQDKRSAIIAQIVQLVESNGYDGIHIDFEAINAADHGLVTAFMRELSAEFKPRNLVVSQAVIARISGTPSVWGGAYDYAALAEVNDFMVVMAYDFTPAGSNTPGAVAPIDWVASTLSYATSKIPRDKLFLGVPFYGYDWNTTDGPPATSVSHAMAMEIAARPGTVGGYSADAGAPWLRYTDPGGDQHEVWYENSYSLEAKLNLARDYDVAGFAGWRIGHEDPDNWRLIAALETPASPAKSGASTSSSWYFPETRHWLSDRFLAYWLEHGGLERFGYPRTEQFVEYDPLVGQSYTVQYFERARFEHHPEFAGSEFEVLLGHIGRWALARRGVDPAEISVGPISEARYYPETGHNLGGAFLNYWEANGGLFSFGYPITEELREINPEDGKTYTVQYFERGRFEHHPEHEGTQFDVLMGLLGNEMLRERGWIR